MADDAFGMILSFAVTHERRVDDGADAWDDYTITVDQRSFRLSLGMSEPDVPDVFAATIHELERPRQVAEQSQYRAGVAASSWHAAYAQALFVIVTGVVTGVWADTPPLAPPIELAQTTQWQRRTGQPPPSGRPPS